MAQQNRWREETPLALRLAEIEIEGFKSFRDKAVIGPLGSFTCIVGPNGCGKSVVGEAIAFALGGNRRMLRAGKLAGLLNQELSQSADGATPKTAQVTLVMELVPVLQESAGAAGSSPPPGRLVIRRTLQGGSTKTHIKQPGSHSWQAVSQAQLQAELAPFNLHTQAVDRYIVTQSRQAVDVGDAVGLVRHLELLTGTSDYEPQIQLQGQLLEKLAQQLDQTQQEIGRLECERASLAPHVATWQRAQLLGKQAMAQERQLLLDQLDLGTKQTTLQQQLAVVAEAAAASAAQDLAALQAQEQQLAGQQDSLSAKLQQITKTHQALRKKVEKLSAAAAAAKVELSASAAAAKNQQTVAAKLDTRLSKLLAEEAGHKEQVAAAHLCLKQLQEEQATAEQQLAAAKEAAATAGGASKQPVVSALQLQLEKLAADKAAAERAKAAAAAAAAQATAVVAELQTSQQEVTAAAAASCRQLQLAQQQLQESRAAHASAAAAVQQAEQSWKNAHIQLRVTQGQVQHGRTELQQCEQQLQHLQQQGRGSAAPGSFDAALQHLHRLSTAGQLPGRFYGRLCNVAALRDAAASDAVNAALQEVCNLGSTLVVSDRQTASAVISHFRQQKAGTVHCKILAEIPAGAAAAGGSSSGEVRPLLDFVAAGDRAVPGIQALLQQLLGSWLLVPGGREAAMKMLHLRRNLVTRAGEVFKQDGEIVVTLQGSRSSGKPQHNSNSHGLAAQLAPVAGGSSGAASEAARASAKSDAQALQQQLQQLQEQAATSQQAAGAADAALQQARQALCRCHAEVTGAEAAEQRARSQERADCSRLQRTLPDLQQRLAAAQEVASKAESILAAAAADADTAAQRHQQLLQQQLASGRRRRKSSRSTGGDAAGTAGDAQQAALCAAAHQLQQASEAVQAQWLAADSATQQQKQVARQLAAVQKELARVQGSAASQQQLNKQQAALSRLEQQRAACEAELAAAADRRAELASGLKPIKQQLQAAGKGRAAAAEACAAAKTQHQQHQKRLEELQQQQEQWQAALEQLLQRMGAADTGSAAADVEMADAEAAGGAARANDIPGGRELCHVSDAEAAEAASSKARQRRSSRAAGGRSQRRRVRSRRAVIDASSDDDDADGGDADGGGSDDEGVLKQQGRDDQAAVASAVAARLLLQQRAEQLSDRQQELAELAAQVDEAALDRDLRALQDLAASAQLLRQLEQQHEDASARREQLLDERYGRLLAVLQALNGQLEQVYRQLTGGCGSAYCAYTQERRLLFSQGVTLHVQPDGNCWRRFSMLSGGQQALATLALSFALQALFPSPFYFFDEADCALDTSAAARVAAYVRAQCQPQQLPPPPQQQDSELPLTEQPATGKQMLRRRPGAQYLLVSHRPVVFESASCLLGVYSDGSGNSAAVVADFARN